MSIDVTAPAPRVFSESDTRTIEMSPSGYLEQILDRELKLTLHGIELRTGDMVRLSETGEVYLIGRATSHLKVRGFKIFSADVERVLMTHPEVRSALVTTRGEGQDMQLVAFISAQDSDTCLLGLTRRYDQGPAKQIVQIRRKNLFMASRKLS